MFVLKAHKAEQKIEHKPYRVVRNDGTFIHEFDNELDAVLFSKKLNKCYIQNGISDQSKVLKFNINLS